MTAVVKHGNDSVSSTSVAGVSEEYLDIKGVELEQGRNIQYSDIAEGVRGGVLCSGRALRQPGEGH